MFYRSHVLVEMTSNSLVQEQLKLKRDWRRIERLGLIKKLKFWKLVAWAAFPPFVVVYPDNIVYARLQ